MSQARHARPSHSPPPEPRQHAAPPAGGPGRHRAPRHRAASSAGPVRPAVLGLAVVAVAAGGTFGAHGLATRGEAAAAGYEAADLQAAAERAAQLAAQERASRAQERAEVRAAQARAKHRLKEIRERRAREARAQQRRLDRQRCARAEVTLAGLGLDREQLRNLTLIVETARRMGLPPRAAIVGVAAAWQESHLRSLDHGLADSIGMFQQRPSMGWGTNAQLRDPSYASRRFYERLAQIPGWRQMGIGEAAQAVQASAYPRAYDKWVAGAKAGVKAVETLRRLRASC